MTVSGSQTSVVPDFGFYRDLAPQGPVGTDADGTAYLPATSLTTLSFYSTTSHDIYLHNTPTDVTYRIID